MLNIRGIIRQIVYNSVDTKYAIIRVQDFNGENIFNAVGKIHEPKVGAAIHLTGYWVNSYKYGRQFRTLRSQIADLDTLSGLMHYLGSKFVDAVGHESARKIVAFFGEETIDILENNIERLVLVQGIGPTKLRNIKHAWDDQKKFKMTTHGKLKK